jgi:hypothetical protein
MGGGKFPTSVLESSLRPRDLERSFQILTRRGIANCYLIRGDKVRGRSYKHILGARGDHCESCLLDRCHRPHPGCFLFGGEKQARTGSLSGGRQTMDRPPVMGGGGSGQGGPVDQHAGPHHALASRPLWHWHLIDNASPPLERRLATLASSGSIWIEAALSRTFLLQRW